MIKHILSTLIFCITLLNLAKAQTEVKNKFLDTLRLGVTYQIQEYHTLNQKLDDNCNCDGSLPLSGRALQSISASVYEPLSKHWSVGADLGGSFGTIMDDHRNYTKYSFVQMRFDSFYHLFDSKSKLRPYLSAGVQLAANLNKAFISLPLGAGLRYQLFKGGSVHIQTAYDSGLSHLMAKNMITQVGFHVPLFKRKQYKAESRNGLYVAKQSTSQMVSKAASTSSVSSTSSSSNATNSSQETNSATSIVNSNSSTSTASKPQLSRIIYFDSDKYSLNKSETAKVLAEVKVFLINNPQSSIYLTGHTDSIKDDIYNLALSKKRVQEASDWLKAQGIAPDRIRTSFKGRSNPATSNNNESGRSGNRRVEIFIN